MSERFFVIGAGGFLGQHFTRQLDGAGIRWGSYIRPEGFLWRDNPLQFQLQFQAQLENSRATRIINLANQFSRGFPVDKAQETLEANVVIPVLLADFARSASIPFLHLGSFWQLPGYSSSSNLQSLYLYSKSLASKLIRTDKPDRVWVVEMLVPDTFGRGDTRDKLIPKAIRFRHEGLAVELANPMAELNLLSADAVARAALEILLAIGSKEIPAQLVLEPSIQIQAGDLLDALEVTWVLASPNDSPQLQGPAFFDAARGMSRLQVEDRQSAFHKLHSL